MCIAATEDTKLDGNVPVSGEYNYGDAYRCDPGDGIERTFYVLEDGDNTTLSKGTTGTTGAGEVSLIMHGIIGRETPWISEEDYKKLDKDGIYSNDFGPITALNNLHRFTSNWLVIPTLPTAYQIAKASHDSSWAPDKVDVAHKNLPDWLTTGDNNYDGVPTFHGKETDIPTYGYWTSTAVEEEKYEQYA